jgi:hypothetical protein
LRAKTGKLANSKISVNSRSFGISVDVNEEPEKEIYSIHFNWLCDSNGTEESSIHCLNQAKSHNQGNWTLEGEIRRQSGLGLSIHIFYVVVTESYSSVASEP